VRKREGFVTSTISCASLLSRSPRAVSSTHVAAETHHRVDRAWTGVCEPLLFLCRLLPLATTDSWECNEMSLTYAFVATCTFHPC
jgi:hypothetical protein